MRRSKGARILARMAFLIFFAVMGGVPEIAHALPDTDDWIELRTEHFTLFSHAPPHQTMAIGRDLELFRRVLDRYLEGSRLESPLPTYVYIFQDDRDFQPYKESVTGAPGNVAGFFAGHPHGNYVAINGDPRREPKRIIYHEYLHYFARLNLPGLPLWLNEGLAEYYSTFAVEGETALVGLPVERHVEWLRSPEGRSRGLALEELLTVDTSSEVYNESRRRGAFYAGSWALAHYLLSDDGRRERLLDFLDTVERDPSADIPAAFAAAYGRSLSAASEEVEAYLLEDRFPYLRLDLAAEGLAETLEGGGELTSMPRGEVYFRLGDLLAHLGNTQVRAASRHFYAALDADPYHGGAYAGLGFLEDQQGSFGEALGYYERSLELDPNNFLTPFLYGWSLLRSLGLENGFFSTDLSGVERRTVAQAQEAFERALALNPHFAEAHAGLGATLIFESPPPARALTVLHKALTALPTRFDVAFNLMIAQARRGKLAEAERTLRHSILPFAPPEVASQARDSLRLTQVAKAEGWIEAGDFQRAAALLQEILAQVESREIAAHLDQRLREVQQVQAEKSFVEGYNEAVRLANAGQVAAAIARLEEILPTAPGEEFRAAAEGLLEELRRGTP